jgi:hypothetical protein
MAYPQPSSDDYAIGGSEFFRLLTTLTSPGDLYESEQSGHALALGPLSDVANVNIAYFDGQVPTFVNQTQVGPPRSFVGVINKLNDSYAPSQRPGRILLWPSDLYDPSWIPSGFAQGQDTLTFITPVLDVIEYFSPQPSLVPTRNDKTFRFPQIDTDGIQIHFLVLPYWGRKYACCRIGNASTTPLIWTVKGITYYPNEDNKAIETTIDTTTVPQRTDPGAQHTTLIRAGVEGMFDAILIMIELVTELPVNGLTPFEVIMSDTPAGS